MTSNGSEENNDYLNENEIVTKLIKLLEKKVREKRELKNGAQHIKTIKLTDEMFDLVEKSWLKRIEACRSQGDEDGAEILEALEPEGYGRFLLNKHLHLIKFPK